MRMSSAYIDLIRDRPDFRRLFIAELISLGGDWFASVALIGLTLELTGSDFYSAVILAANFLPHFLFSPVAGVLADRIDRKKIMVAADLARCVLALGMLFVQSPSTVWIGIASLASIATCGSFFTPASQAALPNLVSKDQLGPANVLLSSAWGVMLAVGAGLGGLVAMQFGRDTAFIVNSISFACSAFFVVRTRGSFSISKPAEAPHPIRDFMEGLRYARGHKMVLALLGAKAGFGLGTGVVALLPVFATRIFHAGDLGIGLMFAGRGLGALFGPFGARIFVGESTTRLFLAIGGAMALYGVSYLVFPSMPAIWLAAAMVLIAHLGGGSQWVMSTYGLQQIVPDHVRGRIFAFDFGIVTLTMSASFLTAGWLAESLGPKPVMVALATFEIVYAAIWTLATRRFWGMKGKGEVPALHAIGEAAIPGD